MATKSRLPLGRVLVIGGNGFLGHHVVNLILRDHASGSSVSVVDLRCTKNRRPDSDGVRYFECDITDESALQSVFEEAKPDVVIHTASPAAQGTDKVAHSLFKKVNVDGTLAVIEACRKTGVRALVYTSSASIVSDNKLDLINADERWPVVRGKRQSEYYSETKAAAEEAVLAANRTGDSNLLTCSIRPAGIIGEGDAQAIKHMVDAYRQGRTRFQIGENTNLFDFTYVENVAHAHLLAAMGLLVWSGRVEAPADEDRIDGEAFFVTNESPVFFWDFVRTVWNAAGSTEGTRHVWELSKSFGMWLGWFSEIYSAVAGRPATFNRQRIIYSCMTRYYNIAKIKARLGYEPLVGLEDGVRRAVKWTLDQEAKGEKA